MSLESVQTWADLHKYLGSCSIILTFFKKKYQKTIIWAWEELVRKEPISVQMAGHPLSWLQ